MRTSMETELLVAVDELTQLERGMALTASEDNGAGKATIAYWIERMGRISSRLDKACKRVYEDTPVDDNPARTMKHKDVKHSIQPLYIDEQGTIRFKPNPIVRYMLDMGFIDMNKIAMLEFDPKDEEHFAQLIGYSLGGFGDLSYVSNKTYDAASRKAAKLREQIAAEKKSQ